MPKTAIVTDTNSGYTNEQAKRDGIYLMPMPFYVNGELQFEGVDLTQEQFFEKLAEDADVTTSMPAIGDVMDLWNELLKEYDEIVYIPMSSGLSSSCEAARMLAEDEFEGKVEVVDNHRVSPTMKLSVVEAKRLADEGKTAAQIREYLEEHKQESSIYIMVDTLKYLKKGGRLTPAVAAIGTLLRIKPVLQIQGEKLDAYAKVRTLKQGKQTMIEAAKTDASERFGAPDGSGCVISIAHSANEKEAEIFREELKEVFPNHDIIIDPLALSIACHIGPGSLAVTISKSFVEKI